VRLAAGSVALACALAGCGGGVSAATLAAEPTIQTFVEPGVGPAITDPSGDTLYLFTNDQRRRVTCQGACLDSWQPLVVPDGAGARASAGVDQHLLGTVAYPGGGRAITYAGWPLYTYSGNLTTFSANANGTRYDGGRFWVVDPEGQAITTPG
jgi:predicted lipoprotein with Yx(FWY)xxD motif